jgi:hypothetical protein
MSGPQPAELLDEDLVQLTRRIRRIVRRGEPWKLPELIDEESRGRGITKGELMKLIEETADRTGLSDRQVDLRR